MQIRKGDLFYADLTPLIGSEQGGVRPVLIIQNDIGNRHSPTVIAAAVTSRANKNSLTTHVNIGETGCGLRRSSTVLLEQVRTIDHSRLREYIGHLDSGTMCAVEQGLAVSFGMEPTEEPVPQMCLSLR